MVTQALHSLRSLHDQIRSRLTTVHLVTGSSPLRPDRNQAETVEKAEKLVDVLLNDQRTDLEFSTASKTPIEQQKNLFLQHLIQPLTASSLEEKKALCLRYLRDISTTSNPPISYVEFTRSVEKAQLAGCLIGAGVGGAVGCRVSLHAGGCGAVLGGIVGWKIGEQVSVRVQIRTIERSDHFNRWKGENIHNHLFSLFESFITDDAEMCDLYCSITCAFPVVPVLLPEGEVVDKQEILKWMAISEENAATYNLPRSKEEAEARGIAFTNLTSPQRKGTRFYIADDLKDRFWDHYTKIIQRMQAVRVKLLERLHPEDIITQGLEALYKSVVQDRRNIDLACRRILLNELNNGTITETQYELATQKLNLIP